MRLFLSLRLLTGLLLILQMIGLYEHVDPGGIILTG
jgi:hypothetical protein